MQSITTEKKEQAFVIQVPQYARFVSGLDKNVSAVDIDVGRRVAVSPERFTIAVRRVMVPFIVESPEGSPGCCSNDDGGGG